MQSAKEKLHILYQLYEKPMYHIAYAILHHTQQTEDAVSEAFCKVIRHLDKIGDPESPRTKQYIIRIIRNTAINQYRKNAREADRRTVWDDRILQIPDETAASPAEQQEEQQHQQVAGVQVAQMQPFQKAVQNISLRPVGRCRYGRWAGRWLRLRGGSGSRRRLGAGRRCVILRHPGIGAGVIAHVAVIHLLIPPIPTGNACPQ